MLEADGFTVCTKCGNVLEGAHFSSDPTFSKTAGGATQVDGSFVPESGPGAGGLGFAGGRGARGSRLFGYHADSHEKTLEKGRSELRTLAERLGVKPRDELVAAAHRLYKLAVQRNFTRGRRTTQVAGACLYIVCRQENKPFMLIDISDLLVTNVYVLGAVFLQLCQLLRLEHHPIMQRPVDPSLFVPRFADKLGLGDARTAVSHSALRLVASMKRDWMQTGRRPSGVCGAALYVAAAMHGVPRSKKAVIAAVHVGETTLEKRLNEFEETTTGSMTADEFEGHALELETKQRLELEGPSGDPGQELTCIHKDNPKVEHFALGLCRACYAEFASMSGGTMLEGTLPPVMIREQRLENEKKLKALGAQTDTCKPVPGSSSAVATTTTRNAKAPAVDETEYEWEEMMDREIAMTESRLSEFREKKDAAPSTSGRAPASMTRAATRSRGGGGAGGGDGDNGGASVRTGAAADTDGALTDMSGGAGTRAQDTAVDDDDENLDDVDVDEYINTEDESKLKQELWEQMNRGWIDKKKAKEAEAAKEAKAKAPQASIDEVIEATKVAAEAGIELGAASERMQASGKGGRRKRRASEPKVRASSQKKAATDGTAAVGDDGNEIAREEAAARVLISRKKLSSKINYAALTNLFREEPMHAAKAAPGTEAQRRQQQREHDEHQASEMHLTALEEDARTNSFRKAIAGFGPRTSFGQQLARRRGLGIGPNASDR